MPIVHTDLLDRANSTLLVIRPPLIMGGRWFELCSWTPGSFSLSYHPTITATATLLLPPTTTYPLLLYILYVSRPLLSLWRMM